MIRILLALALMASSIANAAGVGTYIWPGGPDVAVAAITTLDAGAYRRWHVCTGTGYTITLPAAQSSGMIGFRVSPAFTGILTIDPPGAVTIDNVATKTLAANDTLVIICDGTNWKTTSSYSRSVSGASLNVLSFGATGDGTTNDYTAINAALTAAVDGDTIYFPRGTYLVNTGLNISKQLTLVGANARGSIIKGTSITILTFASGVSGIVMRDLEVYDATGGASTKGILVDGASNWYLDRVFINGTGQNGTGIDIKAGLKGMVVQSVVQGWATGMLYELNGGSHPNSNSVVGSTIRSNTTGVSITSADNTAFVGCCLESCDTCILSTDATGIISVTGCHFEPTTGGTPTGINTTGIYVGSGNVFSSAAANKDLYIPSGTANSYSVGDVFNDGTTNSGTGRLAIGSNFALKDLTNTFTATNSFTAANAVKLGAASVSVFVQDATPTALAIDDLWIETDADNRMWYWQGTYWLSCELFRGDTVTWTNVAVDSNGTSVYLPLGTTTNIFLVDLVGTHYVTATHDATHYWDITVCPTTTAGALSAASFATTSWAINPQADKYAPIKGAINVHLTTANTIPYYVIRQVPNNVPGNHWSNLSVTFRLAHL